MSTETPMIINEVLAFVQHVDEYLDEDQLLDLCKSNFKKTELNNARWLLFETLDKVDQIPSRQRDSTDNIIQDIITLMKETDPDDLPNFVVQNLFKLIDITIEDVNVNRILKDVRSMKTSLAELRSKLKESNNTICDLRAEVVQLRSAVSVSKSPDTSNMNAGCEGTNAATSSGSAVASVSPVESVSVASHAAASSTATPVQEPASVGVLNVNGLSDTSNVNAGCEVATAATRSESAVASVSPVEPVSAASQAVASSTSTPVQEPASVCALNANRAYADVASASQSILSQKKKVVQTKRDQANQISSKKETCDDDGFIKVEKKKKKKPLCRNQCGTAPTKPDMVLRPATPTTQLYVSRLHHSTKVEDVVKYILGQTGWTLRVERLESRYKMNYKSFVVRAPSDYLDTFLKEEFWPKGVVYRRFRGRLRDTSQRDTTPLLRVH